jgi:hypothetical protein
MNAIRDSAEHLELGTRWTGPKQVGGGWRLPSGPQLWPSRRWVKVIISLFAISLFLLPTNAGFNFQNAPSNHATTESGGPPTPGNPATEYPYLLNTTIFPRPDALFNGSFNMSSPQLAVSQVGLTSYDLSFIHTDLFGNTSLLFSEGSFSPLVASRIFNNSSSSCSPPSCPTNLPIVWDSPVVIAT